MPDFYKFNKKIKIVESGKKFILLIKINSNMYSNSYK